MKQQRTPLVSSILMLTLSPLACIHAADYGYNETYPEQMEHLTPSGYGQGAAITPDSILPVGTYQFAKDPWDLLLGNKNAIYAGLVLGYSGNINYEPYEPNDASFYQANAGIRGYWNQGNSSLAYELGAVGTRYDNGIDREDHDESMYDFAASTRFRQDVSQSTIFYNNTYVHYGAHGSIHDNIIFPGVQQKDFLNWRSTSQLAWRTDGQAEFTTGWQQRSTFYWGGYNQKGDDWNDSYRIHVAHEAEYITTPGHGWFVVGGYGMRDFREMTDYNSDSLRVGVGRFGKLPCGANYRLAAGVHHLEYENSHYDERNEFYFNSSIYGTLAKVDYRLYLNHGIHQDFANWGGGNFVDPIGSKAGLSLSWEASDKLRFGVNFTGQHLEADSTKNASGSLGHYSAGTGITYEYREHIDFTLDAGVHRVSFSNNGPGSSDIFNTVVLGARYAF